MHSILKAVKDFFGDSKDEKDEVLAKDNKPKEVKVDYVCPICFIDGESYGGFFIKFNCDHDRTNLPVIIRQGDKWFCRDCDPYKSEMLRFGTPAENSHSFNSKEIVHHIEFHFGAMHVRLHGVVVKEESYPAIVGKGWNSRAEIITSKTYGLKGDFTGEYSNLLFDGYLKESILKELREEMPKLKQAEQELLQDIQLNLSSLGKKLIKEKIDEVILRLSIIEKALP